MRSLTTPSWLAIILAMVIIFMLLIWPSSELDEKKKREYETAIAVLEVEKAEIQSRQNDQVKMVKDTVEAYSVQLRAQEEQTAYWKKKSKEIRVIVKERIESDPDVLAFVQAQDSTILGLEAEKETLTKRILFDEQVYKDLIAMEIQEDRTDSLMHEQTKQRIAGLEKDLKKKKLGNRLLKVLGVVGTVGGLILGSQL